MALRCKVGDLAYLSSDCVDEGVVVEVLRPVVRDTDQPPAWHCKSRTQLQCTLERSQKDVLSTNICVEDRYLRPISGVPVDEEVSDEVAA